MAKYIFPLRRGWKDISGRDDWAKYESQENHIKPVEGELVLEYDHGVPRLKIGDGEKEFSQLPYMSVDSFILPKPILVKLTTEWIQTTDDNGNIVENRYYQNVDIQDAVITNKSKIDLQINPEDLAVLHEKDIAFTTVNDNGNVRVCAIGQKPTEEYVFQATVTLVETENTMIYGDVTTTPAKLDIISSNIEPRITSLESQLSDLLYQKISITNFKTNYTTCEMGAIITSVTLSWTTNKTPKTLELDNEALDVNLTNKTIDNLSITWDNNKTWKLRVTDDRDAAVEKTTTLTFCNGIYYGVGDVESKFNSAFVTNLTKKLQSNKAYDFTVSPSTQYIYYAVPKRLGTVSFKVGGFEGGFETPETVAVTNSSNYTEDYYVYRSTNKLSGSTSIDVT